MNETTLNPSESRPSGSFDPDRAARLRSRAQDAFLARFRKAARLTWAYLLVSMLAAWWCVRQFLAADDVRSWIIWGGLCLLAFETTVLLKLWYWVANSKLSVLQEIKLLRMDLALHKGSQQNLEDLARVESPTKVPGVSKSEQFAWLCAIIAAGLLIGVELSQHADRHYRDTSQMTSERLIQLGESGTAQVEARYELANSTSRRLTSFTVYSGGTVPKAEQIPPAESRWSDGQGRKLAVRREPDPNGPNHRDVIQLIDKVPAGQRFTLSTTFAWAARQEDGIWIFALDQNWGYRRNFFRDTVVLPAGAELVSVDPVPKAREHRNGAVVLRFEGERSAGAKWQTVVKYRIPLEPPDRAIPAFE